MLILYCRATWHRFLTGGMVKDVAVFFTPTSSPDTLRPTHLQPFPCLRPPPANRDGTNDNMNACRVAWTDS